MSRTITLKPGGGSSIPDRVVCLDVEPYIRPGDSNTSAMVHLFGCGYVSCSHLKHGNLVDRTGYRLDSSISLWDLLTSFRDNHKCTWVFAHNLGYDLTLVGFWEWLVASGAELVSCVLEDPPTVITIRLRRRLIKFVDVLNYWRLSVADLAAGLSSPVERNVNNADLRLDPHSKCKYHVEVIEQCILRLIHQVSAMSLCSFRATAAGLSWSAYLKCFLQSPLSISCSNSSRILSRAAYFGGRAQCLRLGFCPEKVTVLDVNSLYPSVMSSHEYPCRLLKHHRGLRPAELRGALEHYDGVADVELDPLHFPVPLRGVSGTSWVYGDCRTSLAGDELRHAARSAAIRRVYAASLFERRDLFSGFVRHFYGLKVRAVAEGNQADVMIYKLLLNSLHGKFAQKGHTWQHDRTIKASKTYAYWWKSTANVPGYLRCRSIAGRVEKRIAGPDPRQSFPAISAAVAANARCVLEKDISLAGRHNVCYCDTDSLHCLAAGCRRLEAASRLQAQSLGCLREVVSGETAYYWGHQYYRVGDTIVCSGLKPTAQQVADGVYLQDAVTGLERTIETGILDRVVVQQRTLQMGERSNAAHRTYLGSGQAIAGFA